ncbi:carbohydrate ABC transporter permease [Thermoanaerobacter mathranii]|uniref:carbohydrate ABC transporter permease n=1 Tax=Thermoanaerobacter mathranii TaxID=583357 RepID=UPI003D6A86ED
MKAVPFVKLQITSTKRKNKFKKWKSDYWWGYAFITPPFIGIALFTLYPLIQSLYMSFTNFDFSGPPQFIGFDNYKKLLFNDPMVWKTLVNTFYAALVVPISIAVSLFMAILLNQPIKGRNFFRSLFFLPSISSVVAMGLIWKWIFNPDFGLLNYVLGLIGINGPNWTNDIRWAMPAMVIQGVWAGLGMNIILYLAALNNVPTELYEAATVDGANSWHKFWYITVPSISPVTFFILITSLIAALQDFPRFMIVTGGGPNYATTTIVYYLYTTAFQYSQMGYASALAWFLGVIIMAVVLLNFLYSKKWVYYD